MRSSDKHMGEIELAKTLAIHRKQSSKVFFYVFSVSAYTRCLYPFLLVSAKIIIISRGIITLYNLFPGIVPKTQFKIIKRQSTE